MSENVLPCWMYSATVNHHLLILSQPSTFAPDTKALFFYIYAWTSGIRHHLFKPVLID